MAENIPGKPDKAQKEPAGAPLPEETLRDTALEAPVKLSRRRDTFGRVPSRGAVAEALVLAYIRGDDSVIPSQELEAQRQRILALRDPTAPDSLDELARQLPTLEALWHQFAVAAIGEQLPELSVKYLKAALLAQHAYARTFVLLRTLSQQKPGSTSMVVQDDGSDNG